MTCVQISEYQRAKFTPEVDFWCENWQIISYNWAGQS